MDTDYTEDTTGPFRPFFVVFVSDTDDTARHTTRLRQMFDTMEDAESVIMLGFGDTNYYTHCTFSIVPVNFPPM